MAKSKQKNDRTSSYSVIEWVIANFTAANNHLAAGRDISTFKCPSSTHAATLAMAIQDNKNLVKFIEQKQKMEAIRARKTKANQVMREDYRTQIRFLDNVLAEMPVSYKIGKNPDRETCTPKIDPA